MPRTLGDLAQFLKARLQGDPTIEISAVASIAGARSGDLVFVEDARHLAGAEGSRASAIIAGDFAEVAGKPRLASPHPRLAFARAAAWLRQSEQAGRSIHPTAVIHPDAQLDAMTIDKSGNVYVTGWSGILYGYHDCTTIKYNSAGQQQWVARYNGPASSDDYATAIAIDGSGNVYVTGTSSIDAGSNYDYLTVKYNSGGQEQWVAGYDGPGNALDFAFAIAVDSSGNVYVTGESYGLDSAYDYATIKYNSTGHEQWVARYNGPANYDDVAEAIALDDSANVYVTGL